jgi:CheY-like chemotaxis protein
LLLHPIITAGCNPASGCIRWWGCHMPLSFCKPILLVEDDATDAFFLQWAFRNAGLLYPVYVAVSTDHAINYLAGNGPFKNRQYFPLPCAVILNLDAPGPRDPVLRDWIRNTRDLADLPIITLASLPQPEIPMHSTNIFRFAKPSDPESFLAFAKSVGAILGKESTTLLPNTRAA